MLVSSEYVTEVIREKFSICWFLPGRLLPIFQGARLASLLLFLRSTSVGLAASQYREWVEVGPGEEWMIREDKAR